MSQSSQELRCLGPHAPSRATHDKLVLGEGPGKVSPKTPLLMSKAIVGAGRNGCRLRWPAPGGQFFAHKAQPGTVQRGNMGSPPPVGSSPEGGVGRIVCWVGAEGRIPFWCN